jgi:hypothetical protein
MNRGEVTPALECDVTKGCRSKQNLGDAQHCLSGGEFAEASALDSTQYKHGACWEGGSEPRGKQIRLQLPE